MKTPVKRTSKKQQPTWFNDPVGMQQEYERLTIEYPPESQVLIEYKGAMVYGTAKSVKQWSLKNDRPELRVHLTRDPITNTPRGDMFTIDELEAFKRRGWKR